MQPSGQTSGRGRQATRYHSYLKVRGLKFKKGGQIKKLKRYFKWGMLKIEKVRHDLGIKKKGSGKIRKLKQRTIIVNLQKEKVYEVEKALFYEKLTKYALTLKIKNLYKCPYLAISSIVRRKEVGGIGDQSDFCEQHPYKQKKTIHTDFVWWKEKATFVRFLSHCHSYDHRTVFQHIKSRSISVQLEEFTPYGGCSIRTPYDLGEIAWPTRNTKTVSYGLPRTP